MRWLIRHHEQLYYLWTIGLSIDGVDYSWIVPFIHGQQYPRIMRNKYKKHPRSPRSLMGLLVTIAAVEAV